MTADRLVVRLPPFQSKLIGAISAVMDQRTRVVCIDAANAENYPVPKLTTL